MEVNRCSHGTIVFPSQITNVSSEGQLQQKWQNEADEDIGLVWRAIRTKQLEQNNIPSELIAQTPYNMLSVRAGNLLKKLSGTEGSLYRNLGWRSI